MGGDPFIGRKFFPIYRQAGATGIKLAIEPEIYSEDDPEKYRAWLQNLLTMYMGARQELVRRKMLNVKTFDGVYRALQKRIQKPDGVTLFHWDRVTAFKSGN